MKTLRIITSLSLFFSLSLSSINAQSNLLLASNEQVHKSARADKVIQEIHIYESEAVKGFSIYVTPPSGWRGQIQCPIPFVITNHHQPQITLTIDEGRASIEFEGSAGGSLDIVFETWDWASGGESVNREYHIVRLFVAKG